MQPTAESPNRWFFRPSLHPVRAQWLRLLDAACQVIGAATVVIGHGLQPGTFSLPIPAGLIVLFTMAIISIGIAIRFQWSLARASFATRHWPTVGAALLWVGFIVLGAIYSGIRAPATGDDFLWQWWSTSVLASEVIVVIYSFFGLAHGLRKAAAGGVSPAYLLLMSFVMLILVGTAILMLPVSRKQDLATPGNESAPLLTALFTATSASCVTGLVVEDTGVYWSRVGQVVILVLFQIGGLGIMTFGAFFAVIAGRSARVTEVATIRDLLATEALGDVRRLVLAIAGFTFGMEFLGAILLFPHFEGLPLGERLFQSMFHSVSAFCNAGFALTENSFVGDGHRWTVWGVLSGLIIIGGLGFAVLYNLLHVALGAIRSVSTGPFAVPKRRVRMTLTAKIVLITSAMLLVGGTFAIYGLERATSTSGDPISFADCWFQSVTFRTAGFNTVELGPLQPATKLFAVLMMVIGASPGSTGGGVKTVVFAIAMLGIYSVMRGRDHVEAAGRSIPFVTVNRALAILFVSVLTVMLTTLLVVMIENRPEYFIDHLFEATSAVGTVGVSSSIPDANNPEQFISVTKSLSSGSRVVIIIAMFLGRVGPLTLLLALAGEAPAIRYEYPQERVLLG
ncbi:MAG: hypothetical protein KDA88_19850 [Planctomycetaceae bacterium]|nr:hypothetical protein [Planctomycetaceae bacterium]MCB9949513.1 hypothetical protein [Planctomycetaceae bacterium]